MRPERKKRKKKSSNRPRPPKVNRNAPQRRPRPFQMKGQRYYIQHAREYPFFGCWVAKDWQGYGITQVVIARQQPNDRITCGVFLVDYYCLGAKDAVVKADFSRKSFRKYLEMVFSVHDGEDKYETCTPEFAHELIYGAVEYAERYGFRPHADFKLASQVLDPPEVQPRTHNLEFGKDGTPLYVSGPYDNVERIIATLSRTAGEGNFHYLAHLSVQSDESEDLF